MKAVSLSIFEAPELSGLPQLADGGALPALVTGLSPIHRAQLAAAMAMETNLPLAFVSPDDTSAETAAKNLAAFLGCEVPVIVSRQLTVLSAEGVSRSGEQRRLAALWQLLSGSCRAAVFTISALMQRCIPPQKLSEAAFVLRLGGDAPPLQLEAQLYARGDIGFIARYAAVYLGERRLALAQLRLKLAA